MINVLIVWVFDYKLTKEKFKSLDLYGSDKQLLVSTEHHPKTSVKRPILLAIALDCLDCTWKGTKLQDWYLLLCHPGKNAVEYIASLGCRTHYIRDVNPFFTGWAWEARPVQELLSRHLTVTEILMSAGEKYSQSRWRNTVGHIWEILHDGNCFKLFGDTRVQDLRILIVWCEATGAIRYRLSTPACLASARASPLGCQ